eukprot:scaffold73265_cov69-Phaeocystis_antarctica.AAC.3
MPRSGSDCEPATPSRSASSRCVAAPCRRAPSRSRQTAAHAWLSPPRALSATARCASRTAASSSPAREAALAR